MKKKQTGIVIYQDPEFWIQLEQKILDLKKIGVKTNKAKLGAKLMQVGLLMEVSESDENEI